MKNFHWPAALAILLLAACGKREEGAVPTAAELPAAAASAPALAASPPMSAPMSASATLGILNGYLAAWNDHDPAKVGSFLSDDSQYFDSAFAGLQRGRQSIVDNTIGVFLRGMPDLRWETRSEPIISADGVAYEWTLTGTNTGTWGGVVATRQKINLKGMTFMRIAQGKITYQAVVYDSAALNRQLGL